MCVCFVSLSILSHRQALSIIAHCASYVHVVQFFFLLRLSKKFHCRLRRLCTVHPTGIPFSYESAGISRVLFTQSTYGTRLNTDTTTCAEELWVLFLCLLFHKNCSVYCLAVAWDGDSVCYVMRCDTLLLVCLADNKTTGHIMPTSLARAYFFLCFRIRIEYVMMKFAELQAK